MAGNVARRPRVGVGVPHAAGAACLLEDHHLLHWLPVLPLSLDDPRDARADDGYECMSGFAAPLDILHCWCYSFNGGGGSVNLLRTDSGRRSQGTFCATNIALPFD